MSSCFREFFKIPLIAGIPAAGTLFLLSCQFDTTVPLQNDPPDLASSSKINLTVCYPDSALCTLRVNDLNDENLSLSACLSRDSTDTACTGQTVWIGSCRWLKQGLGPQEAVLGLDTNRMGYYCGHLHVTDAAGAGVKIPFNITFLVMDSLKRWPLSNKIWQTSTTGDSAFIGFDYMSSKARFDFPATSDSTAYLPATTGLRSVFGISGNLATSISIQLRDDMMGGFSVAFFLSTSALPGPWAGDITGFSITGLTSYIRFTSSSINMQTDSRDASFGLPGFAGRLDISRTADTVRSSFTPGDPRYPAIRMNDFIYPADTMVFVHCRMSVDDRKRSRHCLWSDFRVTRGTIRY